MKRAIVVGGQKGGTGKSTIATNLAVMSKLNGFDTILIDCDKQMSSLNFCSRRAAREIRPPLVSTKLSGAQLRVPLTDLFDKYEVLIVDVGGQDSEELRAALATSCIDLVIIPVQAGFFDLETLVTMDDLVRMSKMYNEGLKAKCVVNRAPTHQKVTIADEAKEFIEDELDTLELLDSLIHDRVSYGYAAAKGQCVYEFESSSNRDMKAANEMIKLYEEVFDVKFNPELLDSEYLKEVNTAA